MDLARRQTTRLSAPAALELAAVVVLVGLNQTGVIDVPLTLTVPLLVFGWLSRRLRGLTWRDAGLRRGVDWSRTAGVALAVALGAQVLSVLALVPVAERLTGSTIDLALLDEIRGNVGALVGGIVVVWVLAGLGEELVYRGYLLNRFMDLVGDDRRAWIVGFVASTALFAWVHQYQGVVGIIDSAVSGAIWGGLYLWKRRRNLWLPVLAHGFYDTFGLVLAFAGVI